MPSALSSFSSGSNWSTPAYVDLVEITCRGGKGVDGSTSDTSDSATGNGANGAKVTGEKSLSNSDDVYVRFAAGGTGGHEGVDNSDISDAGDGGDGAYVALNGTAEGDIIIMAGGGGGGGAAAGSSSVKADNGGIGGGAGADGEDSGGATGGTGGGMSTLAGGDDPLNGTDDKSSPVVTAAGGGGGGGFYGGTGGEPYANNSHADGPGGGGGDGYAGGVTNSSVSEGVETGNAVVEIRYSDRITDLSVDDSVEGEATLSWTKPLDVDSINIYRAEASGGPASDYTQIASGLAASTESYTDTGLEDGEKYYYRVENVNSFDNRLSNESSAIPKLPAASNFQANDAGSGIGLSWTNNDNSPDGSIEVERSSDGGSTWSTIATGLSTSTESYNDSSANAGERYHYRVVRITDHTTAASAVDDTIVAGSTVIGDANGVRKTNTGSVATK